MPRSTLRSHLNIIPQEPVIFPGSVRLNAIPTSTSSPSPEIDATIARALRIVDLESSFSSLDDEMSTIPLSAGQKQLFCLARAILKSTESPILVLDEATSNVDHHTDELMQRVIREEFQGKTVVAVVHKLDTVMDFDKMAVLDGGRLVEFDSPTNLTGKVEGIFRALWDSQR